MTATYGLKCSALLKKSGPLGSLVRMLLASPRWSSRARFLKWQVTPLYSERVTLTRRGEGGSPSSASAQTLKVWDIPSSRCLFRLVPLARPTKETGCSSSDGETLLKTPTAWDYKEMKSWNTSRDRGTLGQQATMGLLPTPRSNKVNECNLDNPNIANRNKSNLEESVAKMVVSQVSEDGTHFRLSPLFTEEMMGFPLMWTAFPFLSTNGEQNP